MNGAGREPVARSRVWTRALMWIGLAALAFLVWHDQATRLRLRSPDESPAADALELVDLAGRPVRLDDYRGRVVLINVWASWCGPCKREIPVLADLHREHADEGLVVLGLNVDRMEPGDVRRVVEGWEVPYPVVLAREKPQGTFREPGAIPHSWLIDRRGRVRASHSGVASASSLTRACRTLLSEEAAPGSG